MTYCSHCGAQLLKSGGVCEHCGKRTGLIAHSKELDTRTPEERQSDAVRDASLEGISYCSHCGVVVPEGQFCSHCGHSFQSEEAQ